MIRSAGLAFVLLLTLLTFVSARQTRFVPAIEEYRGCPFFEVDPEGKSIRYLQLEDPGYRGPQLAWSPDSKKLMVTLSRETVEPMLEDASCRELLGPVSQFQTYLNDHNRPGGVVLILEETDEGGFLVRSLSKQLQAAGQLKRLFWKDASSLLAIRRQAGSWLTIVLDLEGGTISRQETPDGSGNRQYQDPRAFHSGLELIGTSFCWKNSCSNSLFDLDWRLVGEFPGDFSWTPYIEDKRGLLGSEIPPLEWERGFLLGGRLDAPRLDLLKGRILHPPDEEVEARDYQALTSDGLSEETYTELKGGVERQFPVHSWSQLGLLSSSGRIAWLRRDRERERIVFSISLGDELAKESPPTPSTIGHRKAREALRAGDTQGAIASLRRLIETREDDSPLVRLDLARALAQTGDSAAVARQISRVDWEAESKHLQAEVFFFLGQACEEMLGKEGARAWCRADRSPGSAHPALLYYYRSYRARALAGTAAEFERLWRAELRDQDLSKLSEEDRNAFAAGKFPRSGDAILRVQPAAAALAGRLDTLIVVFDSDLVYSVGRQVRVAVSRDGGGFREAGLVLERLGHSGLYTLAEQAMAVHGSTAYYVYDDAKQPRSRRGIKWAGVSYTSH